MKAIDFISAINPCENIIEILTQDQDIDTPIRLVIDANEKKKQSLVSGDILTIKISDIENVPYWLANSEIISIETRTTYVLSIS